MLKSHRMILCDCDWSNNKSRNDGAIPLLHKNISILKGSTEAKSYKSNVPTRELINSRIGILLSKHFCTDKPFKIGYSCEVKELHRHFCSYYCSNRNHRESSYYSVSWLDSPKIFTTYSIEESIVKYI